MVVEVTRLGKCSSPRLNRMAQSLFHLQPLIVHYFSGRGSRRNLNTPRWVLPTLTGRNGFEILGEQGAIRSLNFYGRSTGWKEAPAKHLLS